MRMYKFSSAVLFALSLSAVAFSQSSMFRDSMDGRGTLERGSGRTEIRSASVDLRNDRDHTATVTLTGEKSWSYIGIWRTAGRNEYIVDLREAYGDTRATGSIRILVERDRLERVTVNGYASGTRFNVDFVTNIQSGSNTLPSNSLSLYQTYDGSGRVDGANRGFDISRARFNIGREGDFSMITYGVTQDEWIGRWETTRNNQIRVTITKALGNNGATGSGVINLSSDGRSVVSADVSSRVRNNNYRVRFNVGRVNSDPSRDPAGLFDLRRTEDGRGSYSFDNSRGDLTRSVIDLRRDGTFNIDLRGNRTNSVQGYWTLRGNTVDLNITKAFGKSATGSGSVILLNDRSGFDRLAVEGRADNRSFRASFQRDTRPNNGNNNPNRPTTNNGPKFQLSRNGSGTYADWGSTRDLNSLRVQVSSNGDVAIYVPGEATQTFSGYYVERNGQLQITLEGGFGGKISGSGVIVLNQDRSGFTEVRFSGNWKGRNFNLNFVAAK